jgi:hypothetical protein
MTEPTTRSQRVIIPQSACHVRPTIPQLLRTSPSHPPYVSVFLSVPFFTLVELLSYYYTRGRDIVIVSGHSYSKRRVDQSSIQVIEIIRDYLDLSRVHYQNYRKLCVIICAKTC